MAKRKAKPKKKSPFSKGRTKRTAGGGGNFIGLKDGESISFTPLVGLDDMISGDMHEHWDINPAVFHPCIGRKCPGCAVNNKARFKGFLPVLTKDGDVKIFSFTISVYTQLENLEDELDRAGGLKGYVIKYSRRGSGLKTRYTITGIGKEVNVDGLDEPDIVSVLGPQDEASIWEILEKAGYDRGDGTAEEEEDEDWDI